MEVDGEEVQEEYFNDDEMMILNITFNSQSLHQVCLDFSKKKKKKEHTNPQTPSFKLI